MRTFGQRTGEIERQRSNIKYEHRTEKLLNILETLRSVQMKYDQSTSFHLNNDLPL